MLKKGQVRFLMKKIAVITAIGYELKALDRFHCFPLRGKSEN